MQFVSRHHRPNGAVAAAVHLPDGLPPPFATSRPHPFVPYSGLAGRVVCSLSRRPVLGDAAGVHRHGRHVSCGLVSPSVPGWGGRSRRA
eukprot:3867059-Pleurochrysis_carterae.AAC.1